VTLQIISGAHFNFFKMLQNILLPILRLFLRHKSLCTYEIAAGANFVKSLLITWAISNENEMRVIPSALSKYMTFE
jgi:hypothetical protein